MRSSLIIFFVSISIAVFSQGQLTNGTTITSSSNSIITTNGSVINNGTLNLGGELVLDGEGVVRSSGEITIPTLNIVSGDYIVSGSLSITESLSLTGIVRPDDGAQFILEPGTVIDVSGGYVDGTLFHRGAGDRFFPVGVGDRYAPVNLFGIQGDDNTLVGIQAVNADVGLSSLTLPLSVNSVSSSWYWQIFGEGNFNGTQVALPVLAEDVDLFTMGNVQAVVLEVNADRSVAASLGRGGGSDNTQVVSREATIGPAVVIGAENVVELVIRNLITPNGDNENDYLFIENLELVDGVKKVYFLDRWGSKTGDDIDDFVNDDPSLAAFFERFESGNYICILELEDGRMIKQAVTVLKDQ